MSEKELSGWGIVLKPATTDDARRLQPHLHPEWWAGMATPFPQQPEDLARLYQRGVEDPATQLFSVFYHGELVGKTSYYAMALPLRLEVGATFYLPKVWGTKVNPIAKFLLFQRAFEEFQVNRVGLRCDVRNVHSAAAIRKLGAHEEGIQRAYRVDPENRVVDTRVFSITAPEWPAVREKLLARIER
ncbi:GNAT family N-acetyltransferase [Corynebacterium sp. 3HC-13]|uniref:GNAT family N-acetyltransferase n=1 Tax=Corynebacterium poyangense TaxID=2684405 RepID=UPI001CC98679|nr:GNAT family protein [Corynebacterium poyangense]MBZ8177492.1 GNAT family N-acetyltransferase [Corynebacterium poyangense]